MEKIVGFTALVIFIVLVMAAVIQYLWALSVVPIFGLKALTYGQSMALMILCNLLFKGSPTKIGSK